MNSIDLESPVCPLCGSADARMVYEGKRFASYGVKSCCRCGMYFLSSRPTEQAILSLYLQDDYFSGAEQGYTDYAAQEPALRATLRRLLQTLAACGKTGGDLLEIGCGYGYLLDEARPYFKRRIGIYFSARAVEQARSRADQVYRGGIEAIEEPEPFDCAIAIYVIEHVYHPQDFISGLLERLRPGGCLLIATPDIGSYWRKLMGSRWPSFRLPEHVLYFDKWTQTRLLDQCGVQDIEVVPYPHAFPPPLIAAKLGLNLPSYCNQGSFWLPATTVAYMGVKSD
jgi:SAM-dependent methyltransferase